MLEVILVEAFFGFFFHPRTFQFSEVSAMKVIQETKSILALLFLCSPPQNNIAVM